MTNEEILKKAIEKAVKNGWKWKGRFIPKNFTIEMNYIHMHRWLFEGDETPYTMFNDIELIFSHDFAKAFWGEEEADCDCSHECMCMCWVCKNGWEQFPMAEVFEWQYHLQQMALEEDPIKYLAKFI